VTPVGRGHSYAPAPEPSDCLRIDSCNYGNIGSAIYDSLDFGLYYGLTDLAVASAIPNSRSNFQQSSASGKSLDPLLPFVTGNFRAMGFYQSGLLEGSDDQIPVSIARGRFRPTLFIRLWTGFEY
jgi:hypothetical protein